MTEPQENAASDAADPPESQIERATYDEAGVRTGATLVPIEIEVSQRTEYTIGLDLPNHVWIRSILKEDNPVDKAGRVTASAEPIDTSPSRDCIP